MIRDFFFFFGFLTISTLVLWLDGVGPWKCSNGDDDVKGAAVVVVVVVVLTVVVERDASVGRGVMYDKGAGVSDIFGCP